MRQTLQDLVTNYVKRGKRAKAQLSLDSGASVPTIEKVKAGHLPKWETAFNLLRAMGKSEREAERLANECLDAKMRGLKAG